AHAARDLVLDEQETVEHRFRTRRATRDVDVAGDDFVDARDGRVVVVEAAAAGTRAERHDPARLHHLRVDALQDRRLALRDRADHPEEIALPRRKTRGLRAETREVVARRRDGHELHAAARGHERIIEERVLAGPAEEPVETRRREPLLAAFEDSGRGGAHQVSHSRAPLRQTYTSATTMTARKPIMLPKPVNPSSLKWIAHG